VNSSQEDVSCMLTTARVSGRVWGWAGCTGECLMSMHYYDADTNGAPTLDVRALSYDAQGWPVVAA